MVVVLFVILLSSVTALTVSAAGVATGHGCAYPVPPGIAGSPAPAPAVPGIILMNEVLLSPHSTWNCSETPGTYFITTDSWIELYKTQNQPFNLYAAHALIDSGANTNAFQFPFGSSIAAHGFLVVFPYTNQNFERTSTSTLRLIIPNVVIDQVTVAALGPDQSYARTSDGASSWEVTGTPTIDASNTSLQATPTATASTGGQSGKHASTGDTHTSGGNYDGNHQVQVLVNGVQPRWSSLQLPATTSISTIATAPSTLSSKTPIPSTTRLDLPRRIALTVAVAALTLALFWCWRLFKRA